MKRHDFEQLLNREVDGLTTPEEEATLMDHVSRSPEAAAEQAWFHRIHRALRAMGRPTPAEDLSRRVADRVLAGPTATLSFSRARSGLARMAASFVLVLCLGGVAGYFAHGDVRGGASPQMSGDADKWKEIEAKLGSEATGLIRSINSRYDRLVERKEQEFSLICQELEDRELGEILTGLEPGQRETCRQILGMSLTEMDRLLELVQ